MGSTLYLILFACLTFVSSSRQEELENMEQQISYSDDKLYGCLSNKGSTGNWLSKYNQLFYHDDVKSPREIVKELEQLHAESYKISNRIKLKDKAMKAFELIKLSHVFPSSCTGSMFYILDSLAEEYSMQKGYSVSISQYINYFRDQFWSTCERSFIEGQRPNVGLVVEDETEAFSMVDHVSTALNGQFHDKNSSRPYLKIDPRALLQGIINYVDDKLGSNDSLARDKSKIDELFVDTIAPVCGSIRYRFTGRAKMEEIINGREELEKRLDSKSIKWLIAKRVCEDILAKLVSFRDEVSRRIDVPLNV